MGLYSFHKRFVPAILDGTKTHTIRSRRAHPDKLGNILHLYTGLRRKGARLLMRVPCTRVQEISMIVDSSGECHVYIDGVQLAPDEREALAKRDGFAGWRSMVLWWNGLYPFHGHIIHWNPEARIEDLH